MLRLVETIRTALGLASLWDEVEHTGLEIGGCSPRGSPRPGGQSVEAEAPTEAQPPPPHASGCFPHSSPQRGAEPVPVLISAAVPMDHVQIAQRG